MASHKFGGAWTLIKLQVLRDYLGFYTQALKNQPFELHYIDAFAGSGECTIKTNSGDVNPTSDVFADDLPSSEMHEETVQGSAQNALDLDPPFQHFHFIEQDRRRFQALQELCAQLPDKDVHLYNSDANEALRELLNKISWHRSRAVLFLDPYGMQVDWDTLAAIRRTEAIDVWYLFPISGLCRQAARNYGAVDEYKERRITAILGTDEWKSAFYEKSQQGDMFSGPAVSRTAEWDDVLQFAEDRLKTLFPKVLSPLMLPRTGSPFFGLFFAVSNPNPRAIGLSVKVAKHILNRHS